MGSIKKEVFGTLADGREVHAYTLENDNGMRVKILTYGGSINELWVPDRDGRLADVVGGYDNLDAYVRSREYQGALIGRFCNRIAKGHFCLDGKEYQMSINDMNGHLHGGPGGLTFKIWDAVPEENAKNGDQWLTLSVHSPDGEENYPGNLDVSVKYMLTEKNELKLRYEARTDRRTILNLTNHTYFNLDGYDAGDILAHTLYINADLYNEINEECIPTGEIASVSGTPFDFRVPKKIGRDIGLPDRQLALAGGYDHNMIFATKKLAPVAELYSEASGRLLTLSTDQPCMQLYVGNAMTEDIPFKHGVPQQRRHALCMETQAMPDSPNHKNFTDVVLDPAAPFKRTTVFAFSVR